MKNNVELLISAYFIAIALIVTPVFWIRAEDPIVPPTGGSASQIPPAEQPASDSSSATDVPPPNSDLPPASQEEPSAIPNTSPTGSGSSASAPTTPKPVKQPVSTTSIPSVAPTPIILPIVNSEIEVTPPMDTNDYLPILIGGISLVLGGTAIVLRAKKKKGNKNDPCGQIKRNLDIKKSELSGVEGNISIQEEIIVQIKSKAEAKADEIKQEALLKAKDIAKKALKIEEGNLAGKAVGLAEQAVGVYDNVTEKYEQAQNLLELLKTKQQGLLTETQKLEQAYNTCMLGVSATKKAVGGSEIIAPFLETKIRTRIAGIIVEDGKLLLLVGKGHKELWTPGGRTEEGEKDEECLRRELKEELGATLVEAKFFKEYTIENFYHKEDKIIQRVYIVKIGGDIAPDAEIESIIWFTKDDFKSKKYPMITHTQDELIPDLIDKGIW